MFLSFIHRFLCTHFSLRVRSSFALSALTGCKAQSCKVKSCLEIYTHENLLRVLSVRYLPTHRSRFHLQNKHLTCKVFQKGLGPVNKVRKHDANSDNSLNLGLADGRGEKFVTQVTRLPTNTLRISRGRKLTR